MTPKVLFATAAICSMVLAGCNGAAKKAAEEADRAQRVPLIAAEKSIEADPTRIDVAVFLPDAMSYSDWPQASGAPHKAAGNRIGAQDFAIDWKRDVAAGTTKRSTLSASPVSDGENLFLIDAKQVVHAISLSNGSSVWKSELEPPGPRDKVAYGGGIAFTDGKLVVASGYGYVTILDAQTGQTGWQTDLLAPVTGSPTVDAENVYVTTSNNEIYVLSLETGEILWSDQAIAESARVLSSPSPALGDELLVTPFSSGELIAFLPANGRRLWQASLTRGGRFTPISAINDIAGSPVLSEGAVYAASQSGVIAAIDQVSGSIKWRQTFGSIHTPAVSGQFVFAVNTDSQVVCFDKNDGAVIWVRQLDRFKNENARKDRVVWTGPVIASGQLILASSDGQVVSIAPQTGEVTDTLKTGEKVFIEPIIAGGKVVLLSDDGKLITIR